jgi:hypothetical protein
MPEDNAPEKPEPTLASLQQSADEALRSIARLQNGLEKANQDLKAAIGDAIKQGLHEAAAKANGDLKYATVKEAALVLRAFWIGLIILAFASVGFTWWIFTRQVCWPQVVSFLGLITALLILAIGLLVAVTKILQAAMD